MHPMSEIEKTPLYDCHLEAGAKMVEFAGFSMPVQYTGVMDEHHAVRQAAGLFDVSHMGEFSVRGAKAEDFLQGLTPNNVGLLVPGRAQYSGLLSEEGTYLDDLLIYKIDEEDFLLVVNASNIEKDFDWVQSHAPKGVDVRDVSKEYALLALQGPEAPSILASCTETDLVALKYYRFAEGEVAGRRMIISRTGYTGEDGFELYLAPEDAPMIWRELLSAGATKGLKPAGLGARDSLRLEAGLALYGNDIDHRTTPLEAGLNWVVKFNVGDFIGRDALVRQKEAGLEKKLVGFEVTGRGIARHGHAIHSGEEVVGEVTSGTFSPTLDKALGMAYVPLEFAEAGTELVVAVRKREIPIRIVPTPFYKRPKP